MSFDPKGRELVLKARLLRLFGLIFGIAGLCVFLVLYVQNIEGTFFSALTNPFIITIVIIPFLPAVVLSWIARRVERKYIDTYLDKK